MALPVRFDVTSPYEVDQDDTVFARPTGTELLARIYRPRGTAAGLLGAVVYVHGGAWVRLDRTADAIMCGALAAAGLVVVALDFRQAPDHRYPAAGADVAAGVRYARAHAGPLGIDPTRIGLLGSSSGGFLALLHAVRPATPEHVGTPIVRPDGGLDDGAGDASVAFVVALYPVADPLARYRYALSRENEPPPPSGFDAKRLIASHRAFFADEAAMAAVSVTRIVAAGEATTLPPVWVAQPDQDDNVPAAITEAFVRAYRQAGGHVATGRIIGAEGYRFVGHLVDDQSLPVDPHVRPRIQIGCGVSARDYLLTLAEREDHRRAVEAALADVDALLTPTALTPPIPIEKADQAGTAAHFTRPVNYLGLCGLAVPNGFTAGGLPTSLQIVAHAGAEATALRIGQAYEDATDWKSRRPPEPVATS